MSESAAEENFPVVSASGTEETPPADQAVDPASKIDEAPQKEEMSPADADIPQPASSSSILSSSSSASPPAIVAQRIVSSPIATAQPATSHAPAPASSTSGGSRTALPKAEVKPSHRPQAEKKAEQKKAEVKSQPLTAPSPTPSKNARPSTSQGRGSQPSTSHKDQEAQKEAAVVQHGRPWFPGGPSRKDGAFGKYMSIGSEPQVKEDEKKDQSDAEKKKSIHPPMHVSLVHGHDVSPSIALKFIKAHPPKRGAPSTAIPPAHARAPFAVGGAYAAEL
jgi:hypothetical protein